MYHHIQIKPKLYIVRYNEYIKNVLVVSSMLAILIIYVKATGDIAIIANTIYSRFWSILITQERAGEIE